MKQLLTSLALSGLLWAVPGPVLSQSSGVPATTNGSDITTTDTRSTAPGGSGYTTDNSGSSTVTTSESTGDAGSISTAPAARSDVNDATAATTADETDYGTASGWLVPTLGIALMVGLLGYLIYRSQYTPSTSPGRPVGVR